MIFFSREIDIRVLLSTAIIFLGLLSLWKNSYVSLKLYEEQKNAIMLQKMIANRGKRRQFSTVQMITRIYSAALRGVDAQEVEVEVNAWGAEKPQIFVVGLPDAAVRESIQRVTSAIIASALPMADGSKTVNLAPADVKKEGPSFDLPIALAMASACAELALPADDCYVVGELALDGTVRPIKGALPLALEARARGKNALSSPQRTHRRRRSWKASKFMAWTPAPDLELPHGVGAARALRD